MRNSVGNQEIKNIDYSFKSLIELVEYIERSQYIGIIRIEKDSVYIYREIWDNWSDEAKKRFSDNVIAYRIVKFNSNELEFDIYIKEIETGEELGLIEKETKFLLQIF